MSTDDRGFTFLEIALALAIIGILAALAIPRLDGQTSRARRTEAVKGLAALWTAERAWYDAHGTYLIDFTRLGFAIEGGHVISATEYQGRGYVYRLSQPDGPGTFYATATGNIDADSFQDELTVRQGSPSQWLLYDDVSNRYDPEPSAVASGGGTGGGTRDHGRGHGGGSRGRGRDR